MATYNIVTDTIGQLKTGDILNCPYSGLQQEISLPKGTYKLECWGAAARKPNSNPGKGGYASGTLNLDSTTKFYLYVGGQPTTSTSIGSEYWCKGGWNGGGASRQSSSSGGDSGGGGGASDICLVASSVTEDPYHRFVRSEESYKSRLIVAGGAGGGYSSSYSSQRAGGYCPSVTTSTTAHIGGMTAAGSIHSTSCEVIGGYGYGSSSTYTGDDHSGAGGGWYGGGSQGDGYAGGGSSFAWSTTYASYVPTGYSVPDSMKLTDLNLIYGNASMTEPTGTTATGHSGDGYIRITCINIPSITGTVTFSMLNHCSVSPNSGTVTSSTPFIFTVIPVSGCQLPDTITVSNASYTYLGNNQYKIFDPTSSIVLISIVCVEKRNKLEYIHNNVIKNSHIHEYYLDGSGHWTDIDITQDGQNLTIKNAPVSQSGSALTF